MAPWRIASLTLEGFKSFAGKVELSFPGSIVAIVGPNGAGKSNVCDAIAWVLGEQSARLLRSQTMADCIFAGSPKRPPAGSATVSLVLRQDHSSSPEHTLEIGRRLLRDGTSEYRLNGKKVRLKDVVDALAGAGLATRAYAIIEQGRIGQVLSARSSDRRALLEEAAGIAHFRLRRQEAELKLAETKANLARVADIAGEVRRALLQARKQAREAARQQELQRQLLQVRGAILAFRWAELQAGLAILEREKQHAEDWTAEQAAHLAREVAAEEQLQAQLATQEEARGKAQSQAAELAGLCMKREAEEQAARRELFQLRQRQEEIHRELSTLRAQLQQEKEREAGLELAAARTQEDVAEAKSRASVAEKEAEEAEAQAQQKTAEAEKARAQLLSAVGAAAAARTLAHRLEVELEQAHYQLRRVEAETERLTAHLTSLAEQEAGAAREEDQAHQALAAAEARRAQLQGKLEETKAHLEHLRAVEDELEHQRWQVHHQREAVARALAQIQAPTQAVTGLLPPQLVAGTVADYLNPPRSLAAFLDQAYGELLALPVVEGEEAVAQLLASPPPSGVLEVAIRDLAVPPLPHPLLEQVARAPQELGWLSRALPRARPAGEGGEVYDPEEVVLLPGGARRVGQRVRWGQGGKKVAGILELRQQEAELATKEAELLVKYQQAQGERKQLSERRAQLEEAWHQAAVAAREAAQAHAIAASARESRHRERARLQRELEALASEKQRLEKERARLEQALAEAQAQAQALEQRAAALESVVDRLAQQGREAQEEATATRRRAERARGELAVVQEKAAAAQRELDRQRRLLKELHTRAENLQQELQAAQVREKEAVERVQTLQENLAVLVEQKALAQGEAERWEGEVSRLREQLSQVKAQVEQWRQRERESREALHRKELELSEALAQKKILEEQKALLLGETPLPEPPSPEALPNLEQQEKELSRQLEGLGPVNQLALAEKEELEQRFHFLTTQRRDLERSLEQLSQTIRELDQTCAQRFLTTLQEVNQAFAITFRQLFGGGEARVELVDPESPLDSGVEVRVRPPGKHTQSVLLLSGGEKALAAVALLLALFSIRPAPFCVLDEVDAPLDDVNVERLCQHLKGMAHQTQFLLITHNRRTMAYADVLYGVTMEEPGVSRLVSVRLEE